MPDVRINQVWKDNDKRIPVDRFLRVTKIEGERALCERVIPDGDDFVARGPHTRIALRRFRPTSTGYVLVREA